MIITICCLLCGVINAAVGHAGEFVAGVAAGPLYYARNVGRSSGFELVKNVVFSTGRGKQVFEMECFRHFGRYHFCGIGSGPFTVFGSDGESARVRLVTEIVIV